MELSARNQKSFPKKWDAIQIKDVGFSYGDAPALRNVSFNITKGEKVGIVGLSGAGKSTLLHLLSGMVPWQAGTVQWEGIEIKEIPHTFLFQHTALVFQDAHIIPYLTVEENMRVGALFREQNTDMLIHIIEKLGLKEKKYEKAGQLSGGQKQRVSIGRALMKQSPIILADEPTSSLDEETAKDLVQLLYTLAKQEGKIFTFLIKLTKE
jgi:lipoprotein-releasing system ATP-binding protein